MKQLALLLCLLTLAGCSLTTKTSEPVVNSGSTDTGTQIVETKTGADVISGDKIILSGENLVDTGSAQTNTGDSVNGELQLITNDEGDILFQEILSGNLGDVISENPPIYIRTNGNNLMFKQALTKNKIIQKLSINNQISLYIKQTNIGKCYDHHSDKCIQYSMNIGYQNNNKNIYTQSAIGESALVGGMASENIGTIKIIDNLYIIDLPNVWHSPRAKVSRKIFFDNRTKKIYIDTEIFNRLEIKDRQRQQRPVDKVFCSWHINQSADESGIFDISFTWSQDNCGGGLFNQTAFEHVYYQRNLSTDTFTFIKAEPINNQ